MFKLPKFFKDVVRIINIVGNIKNDGVERKLGGVLQQKASTKICHDAKRPNKFGLLSQHKR